MSFPTYTAAALYLLAQGYTHLEEDDLFVAEGAAYGLDSVADIVRREVPPEQGGGVCYELIHI